tara:strand:+ start:1222 stop:1974 length:753 start_codon:yes stop_codon:yes gene_type:complete
MYLEGRDIKKMKALSLAKKAILKTFDPRLFNALLPSYIVLVILSFLYSSQLWSHLKKIQQDPINYVYTADYWALVLLGSLVGLIFVVLFFSALDAIEKTNIFYFPKIKDLATKSLKVLMVSIISYIFIMIGLILFVIPGIFLSKRYIYVLNIAVEERLGIFESMRRSKELSRKNGWSTYLSLIFILIPISILSTTITFAVNPILSPSATFIPYFLSSITIGYIFSIPFYSALFYGYNDAKTLALKELEVE